MWVVQLIAAQALEAPLTIIRIWLGRATSKQGAIAGKNSVVIAIVTIFNHLFCHIAGIFVNI